MDGLAKAAEIVRAWPPDRPLAVALRGAADAGEGTGAAAAVETAACAGALLCEPDGWVSEALSPIGPEGDGHTWIGLLPYELGQSLEPAARTRHAGPIGARWLRCGRRVRVDADGRTATCRPAAWRGRAAQSRTIA